MTATSIGFVVVGVLLSALLYDDIARPYIEHRARKPVCYKVVGRTVKRKKR